MAARPTRSGGSEDAAPATDEATTTEPIAIVHVGGIPRRVVDRFYDPRQNCVIDVLEYEKTVASRNGEVKTVTLQRHSRCMDEEVQAKYRRGEARVEVK